MQVVVWSWREWGGRGHRNLGGPITWQEESCYVEEPGAGSAALGMNASGAPVARVLKAGENHDIVGARRALVLAHYEVDDDSTNL